MAIPLYTTPTSGSYLHWGIVNVSWTNITIIVVMLVLFVLALVLPFHGGDE